MQFTENEMTQAVTGAAKSVLAQRKDVRRGRQDVEQLWDVMDKLERYRLLSGIGDQVIPVLMALPDVEVPYGQRATYPDAVVQETVEGVGTDGEAGGRMRRAVVLQARVALVQVALAAMPPRSDPDVFVVPDSL